jgi:DNA phosphorothioation-dependent restriction protein DptF
MEYHPLIFELQKLKESSLGAVADGHEAMQDELKRYLHIQRPVEEDLKQLIQETHHVSEPVLLLVCGNVGDGKSHVLSSLAQDPELKPLVEKFKLRNDATESFSPDQTCIQALDATLDCFSDERIGTAQDKWILAINLGTLNNFLEERGDKYGLLKDYVDKHGILEIEDQGQEAYDPQSPFQYINFTSYHFYALTRQGATGSLVEELLQKIVNPHPGNPIYRAYEAVLECEWSSLCPVKANYEFLFKQEYRTIIAQLLVEIMIKEKQIISFRHLLNFFYDMLVPYHIAHADLRSYVAKVDKLSGKERLELFLPNFIFEHSALSPIFGALHRIDPCKRRLEALDEQIIQLNATANAAAYFFSVIQHRNDYLEQAMQGLDREGRLTIIKVFIRLSYFQDVNRQQFNDDYFGDYMQALFAFNKQDHLQMRTTYEMVKEAILKWNGNAKEKGMMALKVESKDQKYRVFKEAGFKAFLPKASPLKQEVLHRFYPQLKLIFDGGGHGERLTIDIDYPLYVLLKKVNVGYRPNKLNRNNYLNFDRFVERLTLANAQEAPLYIDEANIGLAVDFKLYVDDFGSLTFEKL